MFTPFSPLAEPGENGIGKHFCEIEVCSVLAPTPLAGILDQSGRDVIPFGGNGCSIGDGIGIGHFPGYPHPIRRLQHIGFMRIHDQVAIVVIKPMFFTAVAALPITL